MCGAVSGTMGTIVSHPFFVVKTKLQNGEKTSLFILLKTDQRMLYSGFLRACIGLSIEKTLIFGSYNSTINHFNLNKDNYYHSMFAGFVSGTIGSFSIAPAEQLTIDKQQNRKCYSTKHLYQGLFPTMMRESIGFAIYFTVYDQLSKRYNKDKKTLNTAMIAVPSIVSAWFVITPIDKIKTNVQSGKPIDIHNVFVAYRGFKYALMRAIPFHCTCLTVFEYTKKFMQ
jgi:hypothetical protein